jgi:hypothetical protein
MRKKITQAEEYENEKIEPAHMLKIDQKYVFIK